MLFGLAELVPLLEQVVLSTVREEMKRGSEGFFPLINMNRKIQGQEKRNQHAVTSASRQRHTFTWEDKCLKPPFQAIDKIQMLASIITNSGTWKKKSKRFQGCAPQLRRLESCSHEGRISQWIGFKTREIKFELFWIIEVGLPWCINLTVIYSGK